MNWLTRFEWQMKIHPGDVIMEGWSRRTGRRSDWRDQTENLWLCFIQKTNEKPSAGESEPGWPSLTVTSTRFWHWDKKIWSAQTVTMQCPRLNPSYKPVTVQHCVSTFVRVTSLGVSTRRRVETQHDVCAWTRTSILQNTGCVSGQFKMTTFILMNSSSTRDVRQSLWVGSVNTFRYITVFHEVYKWDGTAVLKARLPPHAAGFISSWTDESESKYNKYKKPRSQPASSIFNWSNNVTEADSLLLQLRWDRVRMRFLWTESTQNHEKCQ